VKGQVKNLRDIAQLFESSDLDSHFQKGRKVNRSHLINALNYVNFQNGTVLVNLRHIRYGTVLSLQAAPEPCTGATLEARWIQEGEVQFKLSSYQVLNFLLNRESNVLVVQADAKRIDDEGIAFLLPEFCYEVSTRRARRYPCQAIEAQLIQDGVVFCGTLVDFSSLSFRIEVSSLPPQTFQWINSSATLYLILKGEDGAVCYSGDCRAIRQSTNKKTRTYVLEPIQSHIQRFKPEKYRSERHSLAPSPNVVLKHPLTGKTVSLEVTDLSCSGFAVEEYYDNALLFSGLVIPEARLEIAKDFSITCKAQVIHRHVMNPDEDAPLVRHGLSILDMDSQDQVNLSAVLYRLENKRSFVCSAINLEDLWRLFFEVGFVYPKKYAAIAANKEKFKETYEKLYIQSPSIARHFVQQERGIIQGHISMVRFYENTWLIHHHAAMGQTIAGLSVLNQVGRYIYDYRCLYSSHMDFVICYYRPDNRFPSRIFGGFSDQLQDRNGCSVDGFSYFHLGKTGVVSDETSSWVLSDAEPKDLVELRHFYDYHSGGLMLNALDLEPDTLVSDDLTREYERHGFKRERHVFSLTRRGELKAVIMVSVSDTGLNLSNLTNCIHVLVVDPDDLPWRVLYSNLLKLSIYYEEDEIPVLIYPLEYAETEPIRPEKVYNLWVINSQHGDQYLEYMEGLLHHS
jgi:hypothetical protein